MLRAQFTDFILGDAYDAAIEARIRSRARVIGDTTFVKGMRELAKRNAPSRPALPPAAVEVML